MAQRISASVVANAASHFRRFAPTASHHAAPPTIAAASSAQSHHGRDPLDGSGAGEALALVGDIDVGDALVGVGVGESLVGDALVGEAEVGLALVGEAEVGLALVGFGVVGVGVGESERVGVVVALAVREGEAVVGEADVGDSDVGGAVVGWSVAVAVRVGRVGSEGVPVMLGIEIVGFAVGSVTLLPPQAVSSSTAATGSRTTVRRDFIVGPPSPSTPDGTPRLTRARAGTAAQEATIVAPALCRSAMPPSRFTTWAKPASPIFCVAMPERRPLWQ